MLLSGGSIYTPTVVSHNDLLNSGVNSHDQIDVFINSKAANNGLAPLDGTGKIPLVHLPTSGQTFKGLFNAQTNTPPLLTGGIGGVLGDYYIVNVAGTSLIDGINTWDVGDFIIHVGAKWDRIDNPDPELVDIGAEYKTVQDKPIKNNSIPTDPKHLVQKDYVDNKMGDHTTLTNIGVKTHTQIDLFIDDQNNINSTVDNKIKHIDNVDFNSTNFDDKKITTTILLNDIVNNNQLITKEYSDTSILNNNNILNTRFLNLENKDITHDTRLDGQDTLINNLIASQVLVDNNQNTAISNLQTSQASQDTNLQTLNQKTQNLSTAGHPFGLLTYENTPILNNVNDIVNKGYIDSSSSQLQQQISTNNTSIGILNQKTSILDTQGRLTNNLLLDNDNSYDIGDVSGNRVRSIYAIGSVNATLMKADGFVNPVINLGVSIDQVGAVTLDGYNSAISDRALSVDLNGKIQKSDATISVAGDISGSIITGSNRLKANDLYNLSNTANINIGDDLLGVVKLRGSAYNEGTVNKAAMIDFDGSIVKTNVVINNADIDCKDISCQKIIGVSPGPNSDLELLNQGGKGILIKDEAKTAAANICFTNNYYTSNTNKYLKISNQGLLIADIPAGGAINGITATENPVASGQYDISFPSTQYQVAGTLKIDINGKIYVVPDPVLLVSPHNLTSNNDPNFILSGQWGSPTELYKMFDGLFGPGSNGTLFTGGNTYDPNNGNAILNSFKGILGSWIKVSLNQSKIFNSFRFAAGGFANGQNPTSFILYGSNDDVENNYTAFHSVSNYTFINTPNYEPIITFTQQTWRYIVFQCIQIGNGNPLGQNGATLSELDFLNN